jgi:antitoxin YefM
MNSKNIISTTEARKRLFSIVDEVSAPDTFYTLTERGKAKAVIMSAEEFESWQETIEVMREFPNLKAEIEEARKEYDRGEFVTWEDLIKEINAVQD